MSAVSGVVGVDSVPDRVRSLTTLTDPNYADLFTITAPTATDHTAEQWVRAVLERAPLSQRHARRLWRIMGLRLGPPHSSDHVQGWRIAGRGENWLRAETGSWYATAQAVCLVGEGEVAISLFFRYDHPVAKLVWRFVSGRHQRAVPVMLRQAVRVMEQPRTSEPQHDRGARPRACHGESPSQA
jgi:hypothetical protein